jgi:hypothetical protein
VLRFELQSALEALAHGDTVLLVPILVPIEVRTVGRQVCSTHMAEHTEEAMRHTHSHAFSVSWGHEREKYFEHGVVNNGALGRGFFRAGCRSRIVTRGTPYATRIMRLLLHPVLDFHTL